MIKTTDLINLQNILKQEGVNSKAKAIKEIDNLINKAFTNEETIKLDVIVQKYINYLLNEIDKEGISSNEKVELVKTANYARNKLLFRLEN